jgi:hypothetical protein
MVTVREPLELLAKGSVVTVTCAGVVTCVVGDTCSQVAFDDTRRLRAAPVLVRVNIVEVPVFGCAVIAKGFGLYTSPCADSAAAVANSNKTCLKTKPPTGRRSGAEDASARNSVHGKYQPVSKESERLTTCG